MSEEGKGQTDQAVNVNKVSQLAAARAYNLTSQPWRSMAKPREIAEKLQLYKDLAWINAPVNAIKTAIGALNIKLYKVTNEGGSKAEREQIDNHPILNLLARPNRDMTRNQLLQRLVVYRVMAGEAYWEVVHDTLDLAAKPVTKGKKSKKGKKAKVTKKTLKRPSELWPIRPDRLTPVPRKDGKGIQRYDFQTKAYSRDKKSLAPDEVIPFIAFDPLDDWRGMGTFDPSADEAILDGQMLNYIGSFFHKGTVEGILSTEQRLTTPDINMMVSMLEKRRQDDDRSVLIMGKGIKYDSMGKTPQEADFQTGRKDNRRTFLSVAGVPQSRVGMIEDIKYDNYALQEQAFNANTIIPLSQEIAAALTLYLVPQYPDLKADLANNISHVIAFDIEDLLREDKNEHTKRLITEVNTGLKTPNEAREELDLDEYPGGNLFYMSKNFVPVGIDEKASDEEKAAFEESQKPPEPKSVGTLGSLEEIEAGNAEEQLEKIDAMGAALEEAIDLAKEDIITEAVRRAREE